MIAWRIARGIDQLGGKEGAGWFVGTFAEEISKEEAVKVEAKFLRWLRDGHGHYKEVMRRKVAAFKRKEGRRPSRVERAIISAAVKGGLRREIEYAATWEVQRSGRLHLNLIMAPWDYVAKKRLDAAWQRFGGGPRTWIQRVGAGIGVEAAKSRAGIGGYLGKWEQMVQAGRGVAYSEGWPKLSAAPWLGRRGKISWVWVGDLTDEARGFWYERELGHWKEGSPGEWRSFYGEECDCFELKARAGPSVAKKHKRACQESESWWAAVLGDLEIGDNE